MQHAKSAAERDGDVASPDELAPTRAAPRAIEDGFPFEAISRVAEAESWRKEVWRPIYHMHKWWAQRLGSVFRAAIIGSLVTADDDVLALFYEKTRLYEAVVFDPFMGSGTTIGEAAKLGCRVIGRDINPVAYRNVRVALSALSRARLLDLYAQLEDAVGEEIRTLYRSRDSKGEPCDVLYWFWVKWLPCPGCGETVDLFSTRVFARHAYVRQNPKVQVICPDCGAVFACTHAAHEATCPACGTDFDPHHGAVHGSQANCSHCGQRFPIARTARAHGRAPDHRLYAKLVLRRDGSKEYLPATSHDIDSFREAERRLDALHPPLPDVAIEDGYNTRQVLSYGYSSWDQFFNARQHLALAILARGIVELPRCPEREALILLFSGVLEFNNMFASYKGEGTGAVRHMFAHHVLKPERTPIEANVWGTPKSSGSFSTLFRSRLLRALDYKEAPFELRVSGGAKGQKVFGLSEPMTAAVVDAWPPAGLELGEVYLSCGDSSTTDLPDACVDVVVTDPPFFDNVHYSELADFFHVWQRLWFGEPATGNSPTTRRAEEVQDTQPRRSLPSFAMSLQSVTACCATRGCSSSPIITRVKTAGRPWLKLCSVLVSCQSRRSRSRRRWPSPSPSLSQARPSTLMCSWSAESGMQSSESRGRLKTPLPRPLRPPHRRSGVSAPPAGRSPEMTSVWCC